MERQFSLKSLCSHFNIICENDNDIIIDGLNLCNRQTKYKSILSYVTDGSYIDAIKANKSITALLIPKCQKEYLNLKTNRNIVLIEVEDPENVFYDIHEFLIKHTDFYNENFFESIIGRNCDISKNAIIEDGVVIGDNVSIGYNTIIKRNTTIGDNCKIGNNCSIGVDGFQIINKNGTYRAVQHTGSLRLMENVYVGNNTSIAISLFEPETYIGKGVCISDLVYISHNVYIGESTIIAPGVIIAGSAIIKKNVFLGINSSINNRICIGNDSFVCMGSIVKKDTMDNTFVSPINSRTVVGANLVRKY